MDVCRCTPFYTLAAASLDLGRPGGAGSALALGSDGLGSKGLGSEGLDGWSVNIMMCGRCPPGLEPGRFPPEKRCTTMALAAAPRLL